MPKYADIVIDHQLSNLHDTFSYEVPDEFEHVSPGQIALVPFGITKRRGVVIELKPTRPADVKTIKKISMLPEGLPRLWPHQIKLAQEVAAYYAAPLLKVIRMMFPLAIWKGTFKPTTRKIISLSITPDATRELLQNIRGVKQREVLQSLLDGQQPKPGTSAAVRALKEKGILIVTEQEMNAGHADEYQQREIPHPTLTPEQDSAVHAITRTGDSKTFLLHGITGSGKTEVYLQSIATLIARGKQAIVLVPEIALTPQTIQRFVDRFPGLVAVWHSHLSLQERAMEWMNIYTGKAKIVIGSRSALFTPVRDLGLIVLDEEHEWTYKQDSSPRYHARDVANTLARLTGASVVLGSATPSIESYYRATQGTYTYLKLSERVTHNVALPQVRVVDMRDELKKKNFSIFSELLQLEMARTLEQNQQIILFINRRGVSSSTVCRDCGWVARCPSCEVSLTTHAATGPLHTSPPQPLYTLVCHYCGHTELPPRKCPTCMSVMIKPLGSGTQRVESEIKARFPSARVLRADTDVTQGKDAHHDIYFAFAKHEADILVGTQMIAKGFDLPKVGLVGIILADVGLHIPDFRASEKTFSLLTQVAGRAGRGYHPGLVILQTYVPDNFAIAHAKTHDYQSFYEEEIKNRLIFKYPPFTHLVKLTFVHEKEEQVKIATVAMKKTLLALIGDKKIEVIGPAPAVVPRAYGKYHHHLILKTEDRTLLPPLLKSIPPIEWRIDVDPIEW